MLRVGRIRRVLRIQHNRIFYRKEQRILRIQLNNPLRIRMVKPSLCSALSFLISHDGGTANLLFQISRNSMVDLLFHSFPDGGKTDLLLHKIDKSLSIIELPVLPVIDIVGIQHLPILQKSPHIGRDFLLLFISQFH